MKTKTKKQREIRNNATAWALMAPALIFMLAFRSVYKELHADHETGAADNK